MHFLGDSLGIDSLLLSLELDGISSFCNSCFSALKVLGIDPSRFYGVFGYISLFRVSVVILSEIKLTES